MSDAQFAPDAVLVEAVDVARRALEQITAPSTIGDPVGFVVEGERVLSHRFVCTLPGYPGWRWTVALARVDDTAEPAVLEAELLPGDDALLAPDWIPWSERLADYQASLEANRGEGDESAESERSDDDLDEDADDEDADDDLDEGDIDGVDIDALHDLDAEHEGDDDADYESEEITGAELAALELRVDEPDDAEDDSDTGAPQPPEVAGSGQAAADEQQDHESDNPQA